MTKPPPHSFAILPSRQPAAAAPPARPAIIIKTNNDLFHIKASKGQVIKMENNKNTNLLACGTNSPTSSSLWS